MGVAKLIDRRSQLWPAANASRELVTIQRASEPATYLDPSPVLPANIVIAAFALLMKSSWARGRQLPLVRMRSAMLDESSACLVDQLQRWR